MGHLSLIGRKLLVGVDFSESCERALLHAIGIAELCQAEVELVHVFEWEAGRQGRVPPGPDRSHGREAALLQAVAAQAKALVGRLNALCSDLVADRVPADTRVLIGSPALELLAEAQRVGASLIVLGAVGRSALGPRRVGTTAQRLRTTSCVPVLLVGGTEVTTEATAELAAEVIADVHQAEERRRLWPLSQDPNHPSLAVD